MQQFLSEYLVVEDNDDERELIADTLRKSIPKGRVTSVHNCADALDFLHARGAWADRVGALPPALILLDLSIAGLSGFSVLDEIRSGDSGDALTLTPIVMFTDSSAPRDILEGYRLGANSFVVKPMSFPEFRAVVELIGRYWSMQQRSTLQLSTNQRARKIDVCPQLELSARPAWSAA